VRARGAAVSEKDGLKPDAYKGTAKSAEFGKQGWTAGRGDKSKNMFQVSVEETFSAGHALRGYKGKCENPHGHNYRVQVTLEGPQLDGIGLLIDFTQLKQVMREVIKRLDHQFINDLEPFTKLNPSAENMAKYFYDEVAGQLGGLPPGARVTDVIVWETDTAMAKYRPGA
jgi:6-pyruvoyltetrahydropterin/6-carboxytetrahydropterin synthase